MKIFLILGKWFELANPGIVLIISFMFFVVGIYYGIEQVRFENIQKDLSQGKVNNYDEDYVLKYGDRLEEVYLYIKRRVFLKIYIIFMLVEFNFSGCQSEIQWGLLVITCFIFIFSFFLVSHMSVIAKEGFSELHKYFFNILILFFFIVILLIHSIFIVKWGVVCALYNLIVGDMGYTLYNISAGVIDKAIFIACYIPRLVLRLLTKFHREEKEEMEKTLGEGRKNCRDWVQFTTLPMFEEGYIIFQQQTSTKRFGQSFDEEDEKEKKYYRQQGIKYMTDEGGSVARGRSRRKQLGELSENFFEGAKVDKAERAQKKK